MKFPLQEGATGVIALVLVMWGKYKFVSKDQLNDKLEGIKNQLDSMETERTLARSEHTNELVEIFRALGRLEGKGG